MLPVVLLWSQSPYFKLHPIGEIYQDARPSLLLQSSDGYLWVGTENGLFRYDGKQYEPFFLPDFPGDRKQTVTALYEDHQGLIWTGFQDGAIYYLDYLRQWHTWLPEEGLPAAPIRGFAGGAAGIFWIGTYGEGVYYQYEGRLYNINADDGLPANDIYFLVKDTEKGVWIGTDGGLCQLWVENGEKRMRVLTRSEGLPDDIVKAMVLDQGGNGWIGMYDQGVCYFDRQTGRFHTPAKEWTGGVVTSLTLFEEKELWIGTESNGLWRYDLQRRAFVSPVAESGLDQHRILDLLRDREGNIWVVDQSEGVISAHRRLEFLPATASNIQALITDQKGRLWLGTQEGLFLSDPETEETQRFEQQLAEIPLNVISIYEDDAGNIWIGTFGQGVYVYQPESRSLRHLTEQSGLTNGSVLSIDGVNGKVWLATLGGVTEISGSLFSGGEPVIRSYQQKSGLGTNFIYCVYIDRRGSAWFGTDGRGISHQEGDRIRNFPVAVTGERDSFPLRAVYSITEDQRGHIWFSTARSGIFEFDGEHFSHYGLEEGLSDLSVTCLVTDENGQILIVHPNGIDLLDPVSRQILYLGEESGLRNIDPNLNAAAADRDGNIWLGSKKGIIKYSALKEPVIMGPKTQLNNVSVFLEPVDFRNKKVFAAGENNLIFEYTGLWFIDPGAVGYRYQLEGFDIDWIYSRDREATYSNLPPGRYRFKVAAGIGGRFEDGSALAYDFRIKPPLWQRPWFIVLGAFLTGVLLFWAIRSREERLQREALLKKEKVESQFEALKSQINPHFLFNSFNTLITIIEEEPGLAVAYVEKLSDFYRSILQYREKEVIPLREEVELINNYGFLLQKRFGDNLRLEVNVEGNNAYLAPLTLQVLVENAIKHNTISRSRPLQIHIFVESDDYLVVTNNLQPKMTPSPSTNFGLQSLIRRYELLTDLKVKVERTATDFKVSVPLIKNEST